MPAAFNQSVLCRICGMVSLEILDNNIFVCNIILNKFLTIKMTNSFPASDDFTI